MRVIAGSAKGRKLKGPTGPATRPITDRAKEAVFNMLLPYVDLDGAVVYDLYAGAGSFGIETLSRGAASVTFVERDRSALEVLEANIETCGFSDRSVIVRSTVERFLADRSTLKLADLAFADPPYADDPWSGLAKMPADVLVAHAEREDAFGPLLEADSSDSMAPWELLRQRTYGRSHIVIVSRSVDWPE